jgi:hypothetical protein
MISVAELSRIMQARLDDANALLAAGRHDGASYLCGYAVELALKVRICNILNWPEFPSTRGEFQSYKTFQTHELPILLRLSGQDSRVKQYHFADWSKVAAWTPELRYNVVGSMQKTVSEAMVRAAEQLVKVL